MVDWNSSQYLKFERERTMPSQDLADHIPLTDPKRIVDIGCGPGNSTAVLRARFPDADILGIDSSDDMIRKARERHHGMRFEQMDATADLSSLGTFDVVFSNAAIQWIPDHPRLLRSFLALLRPGGCLAIQTPMNYQEPIHRSIQETATSDAWRALFPHPRIFHNLQPGDYVDLLGELTADFSVWETVYYHLLESHDAIMEWYKGTGLRPYLEALSTPEDQDRFLRAIREKVVQDYPMQRNGTIIFRFPRFFMVAEAR